MSTIVDTERVNIALMEMCDDRSCFDLAVRIHTQLNVPKYTEGMSIMRVPDSLEEWQAERRTARKRAWRAGRLGYRWDSVDLSEWNDDVYEINTSLEERQGRPMSAGYRKRIDRSPLPEYPCDRHRVETYGVLLDERLVAYMTLYRVGELAMVSMIIGHGNHLGDDIMFLLAAGMVERQAGQGGWFFYNRHDSGTDGLRYYKERIGFTETDIEWVFG